ncbi:MAG TPA: Smr/MutS family protein, partial [Metalysinibacillus sp.]
TFTGTDSREVESMIASLEASRKQSQIDAEAAARLVAEAEAMRKDLEEQLAAYEAKKDALLDKAKDKARSIVDNARHEAEDVIHDLRTMKTKTVKEHEIIEAKKRLEEAAPKENRVLKKAAEVKARNQNLQIGDEVRVLSYNQRGTLAEKAGKKHWIVAIGVMKMKLPEAELEYIKPEKEPIATSSLRSSRAAVKLELDLRGERYEEALARTEKYLDDALLANYHQVSIIHGKGTGALREGIQSFLKRHPRVKNYRFGEPAEGGYGVTVVELK